MAELFTTYESVQPPEIVTPDVKLNYLEIQALSIPDNLNEKDDEIDWSFLELKNEDLDPIEFKTNPIQNTNNNSSAVQKVIDTARSFVGTKYSWGGSSPTTGFDCSGLLQYAFRAAGINLPRTAALLGKVGLAVDRLQAQPGDMIWFGSKNSPSGLHIGLVSRVENGLIYIIDAAGKKLGVTERALPNLQIKSIRRIFGDGSTISSGISQEMAALIKKMEGGSQTAKTNSHFGETFATGAYGMTREFDRPGEPAIKAGTKFSRERWNSIFNAFYSKKANEWKQVLAGLPNVTQDKIDALSSISASGNWASPNGAFGKFIVLNWNNPQAIYNKWIRTGITARGNGQVQKGLVKRRQLEANWFFGNKMNFA